MATAGEGSYEVGGGGKFRKRPFRRPQTTPYDRPPNSLRNTRNGWLSKVVDPASRLITASAHRFFDSVFRRRLPPPPLPRPLPPPPEVNQEPRDKLQAAVFTNSAEAQEHDIFDGSNPRNSSDGSSFTQLEQILKQKTFTRYEIDHLTALLHSRTVDLPVEDEEKRSEAKFSKPPDSCDTRGEISNNPVQENETESHRFLEAVSTPIRVLEEDVASPAELAKAYMGSRPSKVSPSMLSLRGQAFREDSTLPSNISLHPKLPIMSIVPKSPAPVGVSENGFMIPRSRGRSALYSMARTPYSRVNPTTTIKGVTSTLDAYGGSSSSQSASEQNRFSGSKQGLLKRRSSVLDSDIGSVGPIRRIRQKPNLLSPKSLGTAVGGSPLSATRTGVRSDVAQFPLSLIEKPRLLGESKHRFSKTLIENGDNSVPGISFAHVPSQSSEMAEKILEQLDKLAPSPKEKSSELKLAAAREKSPAKLTPTMLRGQALKSLENVDSSKILENVPNNNKLSDMLTACVPDARDSTFQKPDKVQNGPTKFFDGSISVVNNVDTTTSSKGTMPSVKTADSAMMNSAIHPPTQKKRAFQMSAHEVYLELDDDFYPNGLASNPLVESREKLDKSLVDGKMETVAVESVKAEKPSISSEKSPSSSVLNKSSYAETSETHVVAEKNPSFTFPVAPVSSMTVPPVVLAPQPSSTLDKVVPPKELYSAPPVFSFDSKNVNKFPPITFSSSSPVASEPSGPKFGAFSDPKLDSSSSFASVSAGATETVLKIPESSQGDTNNIQKAGDSLKKPETAFSSAVSASTSTTGIFSFGAPANDSNLNNGLLASGCSMFTSPSQLLGSNISNQSVSNSFTPSAATSANASTAANASTSATTATTSPNSSLSISAAVPSFSAAPIFTFGTSVAPLTSVSPVLTTSGVESTDKEANTKQETAFGNPTNAPFGGTSPATANTGNSIFGFNGSTSSNANNQSLGGTSSKIASTGSGIFGFSGSSSSSTANNQSLGPTFGAGSGSLLSAQTSSSPAGTGIASSTQSMPIQFGLSTSSPFGMTAAAPLNSLFGSSTPAKLFGSSSSGLSSSVSLSEASTSLSSTSGITSNVFSSNWPTTKSPIFGSTSTGFPFGGSSASVAGSNSAPMVFGSSTSASSANMFSFNPSAGAASLSSFPSSQPVFGNANSVFPFGSATGNHDQMNMEDSMAEDTVQASTPAVSVLGQQAISPSPSPAFMFNSTASSGANPFQFGSQQNPATPQSPSPFQASSSLDFNAGGSFSLGTGGGDKANRRMVKVKHPRRKK